MAPLLPANDHRVHPPKTLAAYKHARSSILDNSDSEPTNETMKRDQLEGHVRYMLGKLQEMYGRLTRDSRQTFAGVARQVEGKLQRQGLRLRLPRSNRARRKV